MGVSLSRLDNRTVVYRASLGDYVTHGRKEFVVFGIDCHMQGWRCWMLDA